MASFFVFSSYSIMTVLPFLHLTFGTYLRPIGKNPNFITSFLSVKVSLIVYLTPPRIIYIIVTYF